MTKAELDKNLADAIRDKLSMLRDAIEDAHSVGLSVEVPELLHLYLMDGCATGSPSDWRIVRKH